MGVTALQSRLEAASRQLAKRNAVCRQLAEEDVEAPIQPLLRALSVALQLPAPLAQWPMHLLHASLTVSFPLRSISGKVLP
jgi:hypothetical protein